MAAAIDVHGARMARLNVYTLEVGAAVDKWQGDEVEPHRFPVFFGERGEEDVLADRDAVVQPGVRAGEHVAETAVGMLAKVECDGVAPWCRAVEDRGGVRGHAVVGDDECPGIGLADACIAKDKKSTQR